MFAASKSGKSSGSGPVSTDPQFPLVTTLLTGDGTNGAQNNTFIDSSTNNFTVTRNGNATQGSVSPFGADWSNYFNGSSCFNTAASKALLGAGDFTVEFWVNIPNAPTGGAYLSCFAYGSSGAVLRCFVLDQSGTYLGIWSGTVNIALVATTAMIGKWAHIAICKNGTTNNIFINGVLVASPSDATNYNTGTLFIGAQTAASPFYLTGYLSNFRVVVGTALYTTAFTPTTAPLQVITNTALLTCKSNILIDNSINQFTLTQTGTPTAQRFSPFSPIISTPNSYSTYLGGNGYVSLTSPNLNGTWTIEFWVYKTISGTQQSFAMFSTGSSSGIFIYSDTSNYLNVNDGITGQSAFTGASIPTNTWTHIAVVRNGTTTTGYLNGISVGSHSFTPATTSTLAIGRYYSGQPLYYTGAISNFRVVNGTAVYTSNFTPPTSALTAISGTVILTCQNLSFVDNSTNNYSVTTSGTMLPITANPFGVTNTTNASYTPALYGGTMYLDGTGDYVQTPNSANLNVTSDSFTVEAWIYPTIVNSAVHPIFNYCAPTIGSSADIAFRAFITTGNLISFIVFNGGTAYTVNSLAAVKANNWYHIAAVRSGSQIYLYINGVYQNYITNTNSTINNASTFVFQVGGYNNSLYFGGYISGVRFTKAIVYSPIVSASVTSNFAPPVAPPIAITNTQVLLNATNGAIYDNSFINDYETVGTAQISTAVSKFGGGAMSFDKSGYLTTPPNTTLSFGTSDFTIEFWVYFRDIVNTPEEGIIDTRTSTSGANQFLIYKSFATATLEWFTNGGSPIVGTLPGSLQWIHVAVVRNAGVTKMYINGTQSGASYTDTNNYQSTGTTYIGCWYTLNKPLYAYIDDFRVTKGFARYTTTFTPPTTAFPTC